MAVHIILFLFDAHHVSNLCSTSYLIQLNISKKNTMPNKLNLTPGTGRSSAPEGSVIVNNKSSWKLEDLERFSDACKSLKDELKQEGKAQKSNNGIKKRINDLAKVSLFMTVTVPSTCSHIILSTSHH